MTVFINEIKRARLSLAIWGGAISFMLGISILIFPEMSSQMGDIGDMFADMGAFSDAFGMNSVNFGEFMGYFGVECANVLGLGGAFFAGLVGAGALSSEERDGTAEFLLTHPISRRRIITEKLLGAAAQILTINLCAVAVSVCMMLIIGADAKAGTVALVFLSHLLMQLEICAVTFGIGAFIKRGGVGIGLGLAFVLYFMNIISNLLKNGDFLKFITPFGYADGTAVVSDGLNPWYLLSGVGFAAVGIFLAYYRYERKDIK